MNEKLKVCVELASNYNLDENRRYNLRQTPDRRSRKKENEIRERNRHLETIDEIDETNLDLTGFFLGQRRQREELILDWEEINLKFMELKNEYNF